MMNAVLRVVGGKHADQLISLRRRKFLIGREQDCQLRPNSELVSRHHCVFTVDDYGVRLRDLGSTNGTFVNGQRIVKELVLNEGDHVVVGNLELELRLSESVSVTPAGDAASTDVATVAAAPSGDTVWEVPVPGEAQPVNDGSVTQALPVMTAEPDPQPTASIAVPEVQTSEQPRVVPAPAQTVPQQEVPAGDTSMMSPGMMPPGMMPPGYGQMPGYPQQPPMYGGMPGYGQMPGYPQQMPMYGGYGYMPQQQPMQQQPMQQQPMQQQPMQQPPMESAAATVDSNGEKFPEVNLPDPSDTGANESVPVKGSGGTDAKKGDESTGAANDIIRQYIQRRPSNS